MGVSRVHVYILFLVYVRIKMSGRRTSLNEIKLPPSVVKGLSVDKLKTISEEESSFYEYFETLDLSDITAVQKRRNELAEKNHQLALENCDLEPKFEDMKVQLRQKCIEAAELKEEYQKKFEELKSLSNRTDSSVVLRDLQKTTKETEDTSEELGDNYVAGRLEMSLEEWAEEFKKQRVLYWMRKVKAEKMEELLKKKQPKPAPRSPRTNKPTESIQPPYLAPLSTSPAQSLPVSANLHPPYPAPRRISEPGQSVPTYQMPQPMLTSSVHPFPPAAFTPYHPQPYPGRPQPPRPAPYGGQRFPYNSYGGPPR